MRRGLGPGPGAAGDPEDGGRRQLGPCSAAGPGLAAPAGRPAHTGAQARLGVGGASPWQQGSACPTTPRSQLGPPSWRSLSGARGLALAGQLRPGTEQPLGLSEPLKTKANKKQLCRSWWGSGSVGPAVINARV